MKNKDFMQKIIFVTILGGGAHFFLGTIVVTNGFKGGVPAVPPLESATGSVSDSNGT